ncbi:MAG: UDP-galactopyranose mutase [Paludibacteraceae bacterium]
MLLEKIDILVVGVGLSGCVIAERAAKILNKRVLIIDRRDHIGGNCFDSIDENGILLHRYGPHYFRTNNRLLVEYLSQFTEWIDGKYYVKSSYEGKLYPFPINLTTLEQFFDCKLNEDKAKELLNEERETIQNPKNSEEFVLSRVGRKLYEAFYLNYTLKQWGKHPRELDTSVCGRIPIRFNRDERYIDHKYQIMPKNGYTAMIKNMISHPNIEVLLNRDYRDLESKDYSNIIYTGAIDEYFNYSLGRLPWRSLDFQYQTVDKELVQPCVQINYPNEHNYTRSVEIKHVTKQKNPKSTIVFEFPTTSGEPYYPIPTLENHNLYKKYKKMAENETNVFFLGRLAEYSYLNMDEVIEKSIELFEKIKCIL